MAGLTKSRAWWNRWKRCSDGREVRSCRRPSPGQWRSTHRLAGTLDNAAVSAEVDAPGLTVGTAENVAVTAGLSYSRAALVIDTAEVSWQQARLHAEGHLGLRGSRPLDVSLRADALDVATLLQAFNQAHVPATGVLSAQGTLGGTMARPSATVDVRGTGLVAYDEPIGELTAALRLTGSDLSLPRLVIDKPQPGGPGQLEMTGAYHLERQTYRVDLRSRDVRLLGVVLPGGQRIRGSLQLDAEGAGSIRTPAGRLALTLDPLEVEGLRQEADGVATGTPSSSELGRLAISAIAAGQEARIEVAADRFALAANAVVGLSRPWPATVTARADGLSLGALPLPVGMPLDGQLRATVRATGNLVAPAEGTATIDVGAFAGTWHGQPFRLDGPAHIQYESQRLDIERVTLAAQDSTATVSGILPLTAEAGRGTLAVDAQANLATLSQYLPADAGIAVDGRVTVSGSVAGTLKFVDPDLTVTVENGLVLSPRLEPGVSNVELRARVADGAVTIDQLAGQWGSASLTASGRVPLDVLPALPIEIARQGGPAKVTAALRNLDPAAIPGAPAGLTGAIGLDAEISATRADIGAIEGTVTFPDLALAFNGLTLAQQQPTAIAIAGGEATVQRFNLSGTAGSLAATGGIGLQIPRPLGLDLVGDLNLAALSTFTDRVRAEGTTTLNVAARGTVAAPELTGEVALADGSLVIDEPNVAATNLTARLDLAGRRITVARLDGDVNGGTLAGSGSLTLGADGPRDVNVQLSLDDFAFDAPLDLRSLSDSAMTVTSAGEELVVGGTVTIAEAGLTGDINFDEGLLAAMASRHRLDFTEERSPLLDRVRFDVAITAATPVLVDNNIARSEVTADLRLVGTPYDPSVTGRLTLVEGSEITLNERRYEAERGIITFVDERRLVPSLDLRLNTSAGAYDVTIAVTGTPGDTETTLTSDPSLPEPDIMALLVTGRTLDEMRGEEFEVAREQVLSYLAGRVGSSLGRQLERATGLSDVRLEPNLIANEADPGARLTVGQDLTDDLTLVYSTDLTDSGDQIWVAEYDLTRRFQTRAVRQSDNSYRLDFRHDLRFGGEPAPRRRPRQRPTVAAVDVAAAGEVGDALLRERFRVATGDPYDFFAVRRGVERVEALYLERGYLQSRVRVERQVDPQTARLTLHVVPGPLVDVRFAGATPPADVQEEVRRQWHRGVFDSQRAGDGAEALRAWLMDDGYLQAAVESRIEEDGANRRHVLFAIAPGPRYRKVVLVFEGASGIDPDVLDRLVDEQQLERDLFLDPLVVTELLQRYYREQGYLAAAIDEPRYEFDAAAARVVLTVREGPRFVVDGITVSGNALFSTETLIAAAAARRRRSVPAACGRARHRSHSRPVLAPRLQRCAFRIRSGSRSRRRARAHGADHPRGPAECHRRHRGRGQPPDQRTPDPGAGGAVAGAAGRPRRAGPLAPQPLRHRRLLHRGHPPRRGDDRRRQRRHQARPPERVCARSAARAVALRRLVRHRARPGRHPRRVQPQLARQGAGHRAALALRRPGARSAPVRQPALPSLLADHDHRQPLRPRGAEPLHRGDRGLRRQPHRRVAPAGGGVPQRLRVELWLPLRTRPDTGAARRRPHAAHADGGAADQHPDPRDP